MDINAIKARLSQLQDSNTRVSNLWKPPAGQTQIRIVPYLHNKDNPFIELFFHYQILFLFQYTSSLNQSSLFLYKTA